MLVACNYVVEQIDGDYAHLRRVEEAGTEAAGFGAGDAAEEDIKLVARALLPENIREGSMLRYEFLQYTLIEE